MRVKGDLSNCPFDALAISLFIKDNYEYSKEVYESLLKDFPENYKLLYGLAVVEERYGYY